MHPKFIYTILELKERYPCDDIPCLEFEDNIAIISLHHIYDKQKHKNKYCLLQQIIFYLYCDKFNNVYQILKMFQYSITNTLSTLL